jgi:hypothetical protein
MTDFAAMGIVVNLRGLAEQRVACPQCAKGKRDTALGVNIDTGAYHCFRCNWKVNAGGKPCAAVRSTVTFDDPGEAERKRERGYGR